MAITITRTEHDLTTGGTGSPASIAAAGTLTTTALDLTADTGTVEAAIGLHLIAGASAPTTAVTIQFQYSLDATNFVNDGGAISLTMANSTAYDYRYDPPASAKKAQVVVINGATNAITAYAQGNTLAVS